MVLVPRGLESLDVIVRQRLSFARLRHFGLRLIGRLKTAVSLSDTF